MAPGTAGREAEERTDGDPRARRGGGLAYTAGSIVAVVTVWQGAVRILRIPPYVLPSPLAIGATLVQDWRLLGYHAFVTGGETVLGFLLSVLIGIPLAVGIVYSRLFDRAISGLLVASQTIPKAALAPIILLWAGFGIQSKVIVAFLISFFPIVIDTVVGMRSLEREMLYLAGALGASPLQVFVKFRLPKALPNIFGGFRVGITLAVVGAVVGEFIGSNAGLGYVALLAMANLETPRLFATIVLLSVIGNILYGAVQLLERTLLPWYHGAAPEEARASA